VPGLFGLVCRDPTDLVAHLERMGEALHAGHELVRDRWINTATGVALGRESLGIFSPGPQPVFNLAGTLALVMEGEFCGLEALRRELAQQGYLAERASDPELALYLFESEGPEGLARLNGIFALAIWDLQHRQLTLVNDRFGLRPLYCTHRPGLFAFAGEIKGLLPLDGISREISHDAVADFFAFGHVLGDKTFFRDIHLLPPATVLTVHDGVVKKRAYWSLEYAPTSLDRSEEVWVEEMAHLLSQAVARRLQKGLAAGLPLSGGLDSRMLLAVATQVLGVSLPTYTYGLPGSQDVDRARRVAQVAGVPHRILHLEEDYLSAYAERSVRRAEGLLSCLSSHAFALHSMAEECQVMMLGNGGDTFFDVFRSYRPELLTMRGDMTCAFYQVTNHLFSTREAERLFSDRYYPRVKGRAFASLQSTMAELVPSSVDNIYDAHRLREYYRRSLFQGLFTINHRLEYSEPYYDYDLVDFALQVPVHLRWNRKIQRLTLARLSPSLARLPIQSAGKPHGLRRELRRGWQRMERLGRRLGIAWPRGAKRRPSSFTDLPYLLRTANREWVEEVLLSPRTLGRGYFRPETVQQLVKDHMSGRRNLCRQLGALITFELWHRRFLD
jgi:asparagine synthase (glutamine-hydrolysing)